MQPTHESFGQWVRLRRKQRKLTQKALGKLTGYAEITVRQIESNTYKLSRFIVESFVSCLASEEDDPAAITRFALNHSPYPITAISKSTSPVYGTPFFGRQTELKELNALLQNPDCRCISIVGVGGVGKTRLARAITTFTGGSFQEVGFVDLTEAITTEQMARMIADAVGIALTPFRSPVGQVLQAFAAKDMLLVLDNFEQLLPEGASLLNAMLEQAPDVKLIVTSRERLLIRSEWSIRLQGLGMAAESPLADAVNLFISTAQRANNQFIAADLDVVREICRSVQGIPLAIEMAASWTDVFPCSEILSNMTHKALDLTSRYQDIGERHRSLQAVFETTWERLSSHERFTLLRLAVFRGGFTLDAAQKIATTDKRVLVFLQEKMLVHPQSDSRLVLHEMIRQLALQKLMLDEREWWDARLSHAEYFIQLLSPSANRIKYGNAHEEIIHINRELENLYAAWDTMLAQRRTDWFDLCWESVWLFFNVTSRFREGESWFGSAAAAFVAAGPNAKEKHVGDFSRILIASFKLRQGRIPEALALLSAPQMEAIRNSTDPFDQYYFHFVQSYILHASGNGQAALVSMETGLQALRLMGDDKYYVATSHFQVGRVHHLLGNSEAAYQHLSDSLRLLREHKIGWGIGLLLTELGLVAETKGQIDDALNYYETVLAAVTEWEEVWNYYRTQISIGRLKLALGRTQEAIAILYSTLQGLQNNPQIGLEIDCFVEIALVLKQFGDASQAIILLEYCSRHPECFQPVRDRAARYLKMFFIEAATPNIADQNLFPVAKQEVATILLIRLRTITASIGLNA